MVHIKLNAYTVGSDRYPRYTGIIFALKSDTHSHALEPLLP